MRSRAARLTVATAGVALMASSFVGGVAWADDGESDDHSEYEEHDSYDHESDDDGAPELDDTCTGDSDATLSVNRKSARKLAVEVDVQTTTPDEQWLLQVWHNGHRRLSTTRSTDGNGQTSAFKSVRDRRGQDHIELRAVSQSGEECTADVKGFQGAAVAPKTSNGSAPGRHTSKPS